MPYQYYCWQPCDQTTSMEVNYSMLLCLQVILLLSTMTSYLTLLLIPKPASKTLVTNYKYKKVIFVLLASNILSVLLYPRFCIPLSISEYLHPPAIFE